MRLLLLFVTTLLFLSACKDPGSVGAGLLGNEELQIDFTDTVYVKAMVVPDDSTVINTAYNVKSIGIVDEPVFGNTTNQLFVDTRLSLFSLPDFADGVLDSLILRIPLREDLKFGDPNAVHHVEVFQLLEKFEDGKEELGDFIDSTSELAFGDLIGDTMFVADYNTRIIVQVPTEDDTTSLSPHLRVRIDNAFGEQFMGLSTEELPDSTYRVMSKGFLIRNTPSLNNFLPLDFISTAGGGHLEFFYTVSDSIKRYYDARVGTDRFLNVIHEYDGSGSEVEAALSNTSDDQEFLYLEPYAGANIELDLSGLKNFEDKVINNVTLELTLAEVPEYDYDLYPPIPNLILAYKDEDDDFVLISDISTAGSTPSDIESIFGGALDEDDDTGDMIYSMEITNHVLKLINDELGDNYKVIVKAFFENESPKRAIIHGNGVAGKGPKLKLVITEP